MEVEVMSAVIRFIVKHSVAAGAVIVASLVFTAIAYFALLLWAIVAGGGIGSPVALPLMMLLAMAGSVGCVLLILLPVSIASEIIRARVFKGSRFLEIPIAVVLLAVYVVGSIALVCILREWELRAGLVVSSIAAAVLMVPLGLYWWCLQSADWLVGLGMNFWSRYRGRKAVEVRKAG
jgi:hypothetical protein